MFSNIRLPILIGTVGAALSLLLVGCSSDTDGQQQVGEVQSAQTQQQQQAEATVASQQQSQATATDTESSSSTAQSSQAEQTSDQSDSEAQTVSAQQDQQADDSDSPASDATSDDETAMTVSVLEEAEYDSLSPRLQLLRDGGYPVYVSPLDYTIALGTPDLSTGSHRISVVIEGPQGLVEFPALSVTAIPQASPVDSQEVVARFARFPDGVRGFHVTTVDFTQSGRWNLILHIPAEDGFDDIGIAVDVPDDTSAPSVGDPAPPSASRTLLDVPNIVDLSTGETPDPSLYLISVESALAESKPFVVVFASPGFCTNAFCGPQAEVLSEVREHFGDAANYIHIDLYENPEQVRLGEEPIETPILEEWGLHTDEWTFVVDADGRVTARFEAFAPYAEVEAALAALLEG